MLEKVTLNRFLAHLASTTTVSTCQRLQPCKFFFLKCNFCKPITYIPTQPNPVVAELCHSHYGTRYMGKEQGTESRVSPIGQRD